jgi:hypothetical protein
MQARSQLLLGCLRVGDLRVGRRGGQRRPRQRPVQRLQLGALLFQPVVQLAGRVDVLLVVRLDRGQLRRVAVGQPLLVHEHAAEPAGHLTLVRPAVERLDLLDRVRLLADPHRLPDDGIEVDEPLLAQQPVELRLADAVAAGQLLERGHPLGRVVVDVHLRIARRCADQPADEVGDHLPLGVSVVRPQRGETARRVPSPARYSMPAPSSNQGSPSKSRWRSPGLGGGSRSSPRPGCGSSSVREGRPVVRSRSCSAACCCSRRRASGPMPEAFSTSGDAVARSARVAMPTARSASRWSPRMLATRPTSSASRSPVSHRSPQRHPLRRPLGAP